MNRISERIAKLEAATPPHRHRVVRRHILDCAPEDREARIAAIDAVEPAAFHIVRVIVSPSETRTAA